MNAMPYDLAVLVCDDGIVRALWYLPYSGGIETLLWSVAVRNVVNVWAMWDALLRCQSER